MRDQYFTRFQFILLAFPTLLIFSTSLSAQLMIERELVGAVAAVSTVLPTSGEPELQIDASFGESLIGYEEGDIIITVGFQQAKTKGINNLDEFDAPESQEQVTDVSVTAYPNPTVERLTVDLGEFREKFTRIRLIDSYGRTVMDRTVAGDQVITFRQLDQLPNANYFLQGIDDEGKLHQLSTVMIVTY